MATMKELITSISEVSLNDGDHDVMIQYWGHNPSRSVVYGAIPEGSQCPWALQVIGMGDTGGQYKIAIEKKMGRELRNVRR